MSVTIETIYDPYKKYDDDTFDEIYERYLKDDSTCLTIDNLTFYKAALIERINLRQGGLIVVLPSKINLRTGDILIDENENKYEYFGPVMFSFHRMIPDWYLRMMFCVLSDTDGDIGHYFAKL